MWTRGSIIMAFVPMALFMLTENSGAQGSKAVRQDWTAYEFIDNSTGNETVPSAPYNIINFDFELMNWQGWTVCNNTAQKDVFWHVGYFSLGGTKAWLLGADIDPEDPYLCSWTSSGGYGNNWDQSVEFHAETQSPPWIEIGFKLAMDTEPGYDFLIVEYDTSHAETVWMEVARFSGPVDTIASIIIEQPNYTDLGVRFRFISDGVFSPQDTEGLWDFAGYVIVDSIVISDELGSIDFENCEAANEGDQQTDGDYNGRYWIAGVNPGMDSHAGLFYNLTDKDKCADNFSSQVVFFNGSVEPSISYPGLFDTPHSWFEGYCQDEMIVSPIIDLGKYSSGNDEVQDNIIPENHRIQMSRTVLSFNVYRDLPLENQVFYYWRVRSIVDGCPGQWRDRGYLYYNGSSDEGYAGRDAEKDYLIVKHEIFDLLESETIQVAVGLVDMSRIWFDRFGDGSVHTPAPWFDNVHIYRCYDDKGPVFGYREIDLFQDNFPSDSLGGFVRADMAADINVHGASNQPGDSIVINCADWFRTLGTSGQYARVYMHVKCSYIGPDPEKPPLLCGQALEGDYGHYDSDDGTWTVFIADSARIGTNPPVPDKYCFDLNDEILTRGYMIEYYFKAYDYSGLSATLPDSAESSDGYSYHGGSDIFEFTCLPTGASDILFVDDFHGRGSLQGITENYWSPSFKAVLPGNNQPDRFDVNGPSSLAGNGLGSRASTDYLVEAYRNIIWDSGNLRYVTVSDGSRYGDKSPDLTLLRGWIEMVHENCGIWFAGDNLPFDMRDSGMLDGVGIQDNYYSVPGGSTSPGIICQQGGNFGGQYGDSFRLYGGCPRINAFDYFDTEGFSGDGYFDMKYDHPTGSLYAAYYRSYQNMNATRVNMLWTGFSFMYIRDGDDVKPIARNRLLERVIQWWGGITNATITGEDAPSVKLNFLAQNVPNPFNPLTTIEYGLREKGKVSLMIYNVAGQLVKSLVDSEMDAGPHKAVWDGRNEAGSPVSSGIYFCRIKSGSYSETKKMVLLK